MSDEPKPPPYPGPRRPGPLTEELLRRIKEARSQLPVIVPVEREEGDEE